MSVVLGERPLGGSGGDALVGCGAEEVLGFLGDGGVVDVEAVRDSGDMLLGGGVGCMEIRDCSLSVGRVGVSGSLGEEIGAFGVEEDFLGGFEIESDRGVAGSDGVFGFLVALETVAVVVECFLVAGVGGKVTRI